MPLLLLPKYFRNISKYQQALSSMQVYKCHVLLMLHPLHPRCVLFFLMDRENSNWQGSRLLLSSPGYFVLALFVNKKKAETVQF